MTTVGMILQEDLAGIGAEVAGVLSHGTAVPRLPPLTRDAVLGQVQSSLASLHDITITDLLKLAWSASRTLHKAARDSLATGTPQNVHLDGYAVPIDYEPALDVLVSKKRIATVTFGLRLSLELFNVDGVVERGRLVRLRSETFDVTATVSIAGHTVAARKARLNAAIELPLPADGLPLVRAGERA